MSEENPTVEEIAAAEAKAKALADAKAKADATNATRSGKGLRVLVGQTRGRSTAVVSYEGFDEKDKSSIPQSLSEFMDLSSVTDEPRIVSYLIDGFNADQLSTASDPTNAFVEADWSDDVQKQFKFVIRNYVAGTGVSIEDAVNLIKPGFSAAQAKALASA